MMRPLRSNGGGVPSPPTYYNPTDTYPATHRLANRSLLNIWSQPATLTCDTPHSYFNICRPRHSILLHSLNITKTSTARLERSHTQMLQLMKPERHYETNADVKQTIISQFDRLHNSHYHQFPWPSMYSCKPSNVKKQLSHAISLRMWADGNGSFALTRPPQQSLAPAPTPKPVPVFTTTTSTSARATTPAKSILLLLHQHWRHRPMLRS
jgi:hypothetical protein